MTARPLTDDERDLLTAVRAVLNIPFPFNHYDRDRFDRAMRERVYRLLGATDSLEYNFPAILGSLQRIAATALGYDPEPPEVSP